MEFCFSLVYLIFSAFFFGVGDILTLFALGNLALMIVVYAITYQNEYLDNPRKEYDEPLKRAFTYKALNKLIQGSAADMTKKSMVALYENGIIPHIQIHDEVDISVESDKKAEEIINIMESAVELQVPNKVDYEKGNNWGEIK